MQQATSRNRNGRPDDRPRSTELRGDLLDEQIKGLEAPGAGAKGEVGDDDLVGADVGPSLHGLDQPLGRATDRGAAAPAR